MRATAPFIENGGAILVPVDLGPSMMLTALAAKIIRLSGLEPEIDVEIVARQTGLMSRTVADFRILVASLSDRAAREPHEVLREILALARRDDDETLADYLALHGEAGRRPGQPHAASLH